MPWLLLACTPPTANCCEETAIPQDTGDRPVEDAGLTLQVNVPAQVIWFDTDIEYAYTTDDDGVLVFDEPYDHGVLWVFADGRVGMHFYAGGLSGQVPVELKTPGGCPFEVDIPCTPHPVPGAGDGWSLQPDDFDNYTVPDPGYPVFAPTPAGWELAVVANGLIPLQGAVTLSP